MLKLKLSNYFDLLFYLWKCRNDEIGNKGYVYICLM